MAKTIALSNGLSIPSVGLGTWKSEPGQVRAAVISAIESGYRHIDCAAGYGNEKEVGEALHDVFARGVVKREEVWVTSKLWVANTHPIEKIAPALEKTLADLQLTYLDLYLVHWPYMLTPDSPFPAPVENRLGYQPEKYLATWHELEKAYDAGKVKALGTSNMTAKKLAVLLKDARVKPVVNQVELHPFLPQEELKAWCGRHGITLTGYSPLGSPDRPARLVEDGDPAPLHDAIVGKIAAAHGVTPAQVLIRWAVQRGTVVIPKSVTPARIAANADVFGFTLTDADLAELAGLANGQRLIKGYPWLLEGQKWQELWDADFDYATTVA